jgi:hypothetical protein
MATFIGSNISPRYSRVPKVLFSFDLLPNLAKSSFGFLLVHLPHIELKKKTLTRSKNSNLIMLNHKWKFTSIFYQHH